jgi:hypothetical protein
MKYLIPLIILTSCNPCKRIAKDFIKHPDCYVAMQTTDSIIEWSQPDTIYIRRTIELDTAALMDSLGFILQLYKEHGKDTFFSELIRIIPSKIKVEPLLIQNEKVKIRAWIEGGQLKVDYESYPQRITTYITKTEFNPQYHIPRWVWLVWVILVLIIVYLLKK